MVRAPVPARAEPTTRSSPGVHEILTTGFGGRRLAFCVLHDGQYLGPELLRCKDYPPPFLLEKAVIGGIMIGLHNVRDLAVGKDGIHEPSLDLVIERDDPFKFCRGLSIFLHIFGRGAAPFKLRATGLAPASRIRVFAAAICAVFHCNALQRPLECTAKAQWHPTSQALSKEYTPPEEQSTVWRLFGGFILLTAAPVIDFPMRPVWGSAEDVRW